MLALSDKWAPILISEPETGMGYQIGSIFLNDGTFLDNVTISGDYIIKIGESSTIPFNEADIQRIEANHGRPVAKIVLPQKDQPSDDIAFSRILGTSHRIPSTPGVSARVPLATLRLTL